MNSSTSNYNLITFFSSNVTAYNYYFFVLKLRDDVTCNSLLPNPADCTYTETLQKVWFSAAYWLWGTLLQYSSWACQDFIVCGRGVVVVVERARGGQFTNPFICSARRMSVWFQLGAAICLLRNKLKWITRLMAFWLGAVQTSGSQCPAFLLSSLSRMDEDGTRHHARPLSGSCQPGESSRWLLCTWLTPWNMSRAFSLGDDGWGWD